MFKKSFLLNLSFKHKIFYKPYLYYNIYIRNLKFFFKDTLSQDKEDLFIKKFFKNKIGDKIPSCITKDKDRYQRVVAECFIGNESLSRFMVREGYAVAYSQYSKDFVEDEKFAKENRLGIWSMSFQMPSDYRKASRNK